MEEQIWEYLMSCWVIGLVGVSVVLAAVIILFKPAFDTFFEVLEKKGDDR